jgi:hypothetical protein
MPMPSFPVSLLVEKQIKPLIESKIIKEIKYNLFHKGKNAWYYEASLKDIDKIKDAEIKYADSNFIITDDYMIEFGYHTGNLRYFDDIADVNLSPSIKSLSDGYLLTFIFADNSCMVLILYSWETRLIISDIELGQRKISVMPKSPIEITDDAAFTLENFSKWLKERENTIISVNCSSSKGAFDIYNHAMSYLLLISNIHPKTKTKNLTSNEIKNLYNNIKNLVNDYKDGSRVYGFSDIYGVYQEPLNNIVKMDSSMLGKPCPLCGALIESVPCGATKMYFCPNCQIKK